MRASSVQRLIRTGLLAALALVALPAAAGAAIVPQPLPGDESAFVTNGHVRAVKPAGDFTYIGGDFTELHADAVGFARVSPNSGRRLAKSPTTDGEVFTTVSDGQGGYFIGGNFHRVNGRIRSLLAHILPDGSLDPDFTPQVRHSGPGTLPYVSAIAVAGSSLYIGGFFSDVSNARDGFSEVSRSNIAKISATTGNPFTGWDANANEPVAALATDGTNVFAGGQFTTIGGQTRNHIAKLSGSSGNAFSAFNPGADDDVIELVLAGGSLYVGGTFDMVGTNTRGGLAKLNPTNGGVFSWDPNPNNHFVSTIAVDGDAVYVGGLFSTIGGASRPRLAKLSATSGNAFSGWNPALSGDLPVLGALVDALTVDDAGVYVGGNFDGISGQPRNNVAKLNKANAANVPGFDVNSDTEVFTLARSGGSLGVGGSFETINSVARDHIAKLDSNGAPTAWNPDADSGVNALDVSADGTAVYAGGAFNNIGGLEHEKVAKLSAASGNAFASFDPTNANNTVRALELDGSALYVGGSFTTIGNQTRNRIAKLSATSGNAVSTWDPSVSTPGGVVNALAVDGDWVYAGGVFNGVGPVLVNNLAKIRKVEGTARSIWTPDPDNAVSALSLAGSALYVGGQFTDIAGGTRPNLAKISPASGNLFSWNAQASGPVRAVAAMDTAVYAGGEFTNIGGDNDHPRLAKLSPTSANAFFTFAPEPDAPVLAVAKAGSKVHAGGEFTTVAGRPRRGYAQFSSP